MDLQTSVKTCLTQKYAGFSGRASRSEYWWFALVVFIGGIIASMLGSLILTVYYLALLSPMAAAGYRRLQDTGRPGWQIFIPMGLGLIGMLLMPSAPVVEGGQMTNMPSMGSMGFMALFGLVQLVVGLVFLWWLTRPSEPQANQYGPVPAT